MPDWVVPLSDVRFTDEEVEAVADTYRSGWLSQGPRVGAFETAFAEYLHCRHAVAVANGTVALELICAGLRLGEGDEVVLPSLTFAATAAAVVHAGATPVFADICGVNEPWLSPLAVEAALTARTRAIVNVGYSGHPGEVVALRELADSRGLALIDDAAHALGAHIGDRAVGRFGHATAFSFFANKNLPLGEGGMVVTEDSQLAKRMRSLRSHGLTADTWARHTGEAAEYTVLEPGFNFRLDEPRAALGLLMLGRLEEDNRRRALAAARYLRELESLDGLSSAIKLDAVAGVPPILSAWHIFPVRLDPRVDRATFRAGLAEAGVQTSIHYPPLHRTPAFADAPAGSLAQTERYARQTLTIPLFPQITEAQQERVLESIAETLRKLA